MGEHDPFFDDAAEDFDGPRTTSDGLVTCRSKTHCESDEACSQGGYCVNITGERDATQAIQRDLNELRAAVGVGTPYTLPPNSILLLNDLDGNGVALEIDKQVIFDGAGSLLRIENDKIGVRVTQEADWSMIRDLRIDPQNPSSEHDGIGIDVRGHGIRLDNIFFWRLGTGIRAHTTVDDEFANVNSQQWSRLVFRSNHNYSIDVRGGDANAGLMSGIEIVGSAGIYDRSFLGNTYIAPTMEGTYEHSITLDSNAGRNLVLGAYVEEGDPNPKSDSMHDLHVGGNAIERVEGPGDRIGGRSARVHFKEPESGMAVRIPGSDHAAFAWKHPQEDAWWYLRYWGNESLLRWGFSHENSGVAPFYWTGGEHADGPAHVEFPGE